MKKLAYTLLVFTALLPAVPVQATESIARFWDEAILEAIRRDSPHPPVHARNLFSLSVAMYDAWAAYDSNAVGFVYHAKHTAPDVAAARHQAISYAAYRLLRERFVYSRTASNTLATFDAHMLSLGYPTNDFTTDTSTPAGVGNTVYATVSGYFMNDGARQSEAYADYPVAEGGYVSYNQPMPTGLPGVGPGLYDPNRWQPLAITNGVDQNGFPMGPVQNFVGAQWLNVRPFALDRSLTNTPWINPGPPPFWGTATDAEFKSNVVAVIRAASELTPDDGVSMDISPGGFGNNTLGFNDGSGYPTNPVTGQPYTANVVKRGDFVRVLAEFWADGPSSETPPGHWNTIANAVSDSPDLIKRIGGTGPVVDDLEWDVKMYFALNGAVHDAACAAWSLKRFYDGWRPLTAIRFLGQLGQSSNPAGSSYNPGGLPLVPGLIEIVTPQMRSTNLTLQNGKVAILSWPGQPANTTNNYSGVRWIHPFNWMPYQRANFVTPAFPGYISGHSTFSRSAAEVLTAFTGSKYFPGGLGTFTAQSNTFLAFERGPSREIQLQWGSYYDAADQAGLSRIWGGIHPPVDDFLGRRVGSQVGSNAWALARQYFDGSITNSPIQLALRSLPNAQCEVRFPTLRGLYYKLQATPDLGQPFTDVNGDFTRATDSQASSVGPMTGAKYFRVLRTTAP